MYFDIMEKSDRSCGIGFIIQHFSTFFQRLSAWKRTDFPSQTWFPSNQVVSLNLERFNNTLGYSNRKLDRGKNAFLLLEMGLSLRTARRKCDNADTCWENGQLLTGLIHGREAAASIFRRSPAGCWAVWSLLWTGSGDVSTAGHPCQGSRRVTQLGSCLRLLSLTQTGSCITSLSPTTAPVGNPFT